MYITRVYKSRNPYNNQGNYLLGLLRNNSNVSDSKLEKFKRMPMQKKFEVTNQDKVLNKTICIELS